MKKKNTLSRITIIAVLAFLFVNITQAKETQFSGTWKINKDESKLNEQFSLAPSKMIITQEGNNIHFIRYVSMQGQEMTIDEKFTLDGEECENPGFQGSVKKSTAKWSEDKKSLEIITKMESDYGTMDTKQVYSFEGSKLKVVSTFSSPNGDSSETWILDKE